VYPPALGIFLDCDFVIDLIFERIFCTQGVSRKSLGMDGMQNIKNPDIISAIDHTPRIEEL